jgi:hypothetical protein
MVQVLVVRENDAIMNIKISGHANAGPKGYDLVCASISSIATGALNALDAAYPDDVELSLSEVPDAVIEIKVLQNHQNLQALLRMLVIQVQTLAENQSKYITIKEV